MYERQAVVALAGKRVVAALESVVISEEVRRAADLRPDAGSRVAMLLLFMTTFNIYIYLPYHTTPVPRETHSILLDNPNLQTKMTMRVPYVQIHEWSYSPSTYFSPPTQRSRPNGPPD